LIDLVGFTVEKRMIVGMMRELIFIESILSKQTKAALQLLRTDLREFIHDPSRWTRLETLLLSPLDLILVFSDDLE
jgi:hypothetical protein